MFSRNSRGTESCRKVNRHSERAILEELKTCAVVLNCFPHKEQLDSVQMFQSFKLLGEGTAS